MVCNRKYYSRSSSKRLVCVIVSMLTFLFVFSACDDSTPTIGTIKHMVLYDYREEASLPNERLAVYVDLQSDPIRINSMTITSNETDLIWFVDNPLSLEDDSNNTVWIGSSNLITTPDVPLPQGQYTVTYTDLAQRKTDISFFVNKIENKAEIKKEDYIDTAIALYDVDGTLVHYGREYRQLSDAELLHLYPSAKTKRSVFVSRDGESAILEVPVELIAETEL